MAAVEYTGEVVPVSAQEYTGEVIPLKKPPVTPAAAPAPRTLLQTLNPLNNPLVAGAAGLVEGATNLVTGAGSAAIGGLRGLNALAAGEGMDEATRRIQETTRDYTYQPSTEQGQTVVKAATVPFEAAGKAGGYVGKVLGQSLSGKAPTSEKSQRWGDVGELVGKVGTEAGLTVAGARPVLRAAPAIGEAITNPTGTPKGFTTLPETASRQVASKLDAMKIADIKGYVNPAMESTGKPALIEHVAGINETTHAARAKNQEISNRIALNDVLGAPEAHEITPEIVARAEARAMEPRREIEQLGPIPLKGDATFRATVGNLDDLAGVSSGARQLIEKAPEAVAAACVPAPVPVNVSRAEPVAVAAATATRPSWK